MAACCFLLSWEEDRYEGYHGPLDSDEDVLKVSELYLRECCMEDLPEEPDEHDEDEAGVSSLLCFFRKGSCERRAFAAGAWTRGGITGRLIFQKCESSHAG